MSIHGGKHSRAWQRKAAEYMGVPWLAAGKRADVKTAIAEVCEAIPPAYTEHVGARLLETLAGRKAA